MSTESEIAWLAGFLDGEGCIVLNHQRDPIEGGWPKIRTLVSVANCNRPNIERVKTTLFSILGRERRYVIRPPRNRRQGSYTLNVSSHAEIKMLLTTLLPHLAGKRPQAELMLEYLAIAPGPSHLNEYDERHTEMVRRMHQLNARAGSIYFVEGNTEGSPLSSE